MGLDIRFAQRRIKYCPHCGEVVGTEDVRFANGGGRSWYTVLESIGYYAPYDQRTEENDWYGKDMVLTAEQAKEIYHFIGKHDVYCHDDIRGLIATALFENDSVVINADW